MFIYEESTSHHLFKDNVQKVDIRLKIFFDTNDLDSTCYSIHIYYTLESFNLILKLRSVFSMRLMKQILLKGVLVNI